MNAPPPTCPVCNIGALGPHCPQGSACAWDRCHARHCGAVVERVTGRHCHGAVLMGCSLCEKRRAA